MLDADDSEEKRPVKVETDFVRKKVTKRDIEKWEVAQLDSNIVPQSKPSQIFEKLEEKRKIRHENLLQQLAKSLYEVNQKTEKNITISSEELKAHCKHFDDTLKEILKNFNKPEVAIYCSSVFVKLQSQANSFKSQQQRLVDELHEDLIKFENDRAKENEQILRLASEEIRKAGYFLPYEVQTFVEHETLKMNKLSLNNRRCYEDLRLTLTLATEQTYKSFMDQVYCIRETWVQQRALHNFYNVPALTERRIYKVLPEDYVRYEVKGRELKLRMLLGSPYHTCNCEEWIENVIQALAILDFHGENLIDTYKKTLNAVYSGFDCEIDEIQAQLQAAESCLISERAIKPIFFIASSLEIKELEEMEIYWQDILPDIQVYYYSLLEFLVEAEKLWERHLERICESKKLILKALEKADVNNQAVLQDLEIKLNISLDALRQEHNEGKLEKAYEAVVAILNSLKAKYESMYLEDVAAVEDFYKMMNLEADVLSADIKEFIHETYPVDVSRIIHSHSDHIRYLPVGKTILRDIELCSSKIQAIKSWKQGVWLALETLSGKCRTALAPRAESWISKKIESLAARKSIQLELLDKRFERVRIEFYEKRLSEINAHQESFNDQKKRIQFVLSQLKEEFQNLIAKETNRLNYVKQNLDDIEENAPLENLPGIIRGNQITMQRKKEEFENDLKMTFERYRADCNNKINDLQQANIRFMKSIKLFHEGGNYSSEEGKTFINMLENVDKEISTDVKNLLKDLAKEETDIIKKVSAMFNPVIALFGVLHEETLFNQEVQQRFRMFAEEIREVTKTLKKDLEFLADQCRSLCKTIKKSTDGGYDAADKFWNFVTELLYRNIRHLLFPISVPDTPTESNAADENLESQNGESDICCCARKFSVNFTSSKTILVRTSEKEKSFACKDYRSQLFNSDNPPENDGTFMAVMCNNFWEEMDLLQRAACDFYKKVQGRKIIREDLIPNNYDTFVAQTLDKLKYYNMQIQQFWLQMILDFLPLLGRIKSLANDFLERKLEDYKNAALKTLDNFEENFVSCMESQTCENETQLQYLDSRLLPLHGYPQNADLLTGLQEEVVRETAKQQVKLESLIKKFKNELNCFRVHHILQKLEINKIETTYTKLQNTIFVEELGNGVLDKILNECNSEKFSDKRFPTGDSTTEKEGESWEGSLASGEVPDEYKLDIVPLKENLHSVQTYLHQLKQIINWERSSETKPDTCPPCSSDSQEVLPGEDGCAKFCKPKLNILLEIVNFELPVGDILETLDKYVRKLKRFAKSREKVHEADLYKWLEKWKFNVKKVLKLYSVMYEEKEEKQEERPPQPNQNGKGKKSDATSEENLFRRPFQKAQPKTPKVRNPLQRNRAVSNENKKVSGVVDHSTTNSQKSKLTEVDNSDQGFANAQAGLIVSPRNYHGQIPVLSRHSLYLGKSMSPPVTRSPSPLKKQTQKEKSSNKLKTITLEQETKKKSKPHHSRSPSPSKQTSGNYKKSQHATTASASSPAPGQSKNSEKLVGVKRVDSSKQTSPRVNSPTKRKSKVFSSSNVDFSGKGSKSGKDLQRPCGDTNPIIIKQTSHPSLFTNEKIIAPQEKISLDHIKNEVYTGDHRRLSLEKVHLCIEKTVENFNLAERKRSYLVTYSSEDIQKQEEISLSFLKNMSSTNITSYTRDIEQNSIAEDAKESKSAIRTLSGHELILTPSMKLDIDKEESENLEISQILQSQEDSFDDKTDLHILQDDENEYDSEVSTDGEEERRDKSFKGRNSSDPQTANSLWRSREADLLNDVAYRQAVYHPTVSRRQNNKDGEMEFRPKSKSIEDNFGFSNSGKRVVRTRSTHLNNKYVSQCFTTDKMDSCSNDRSWASSFDKSDEKPMYNTVIQDVPLYGIKRIRTKKERISGAFLRFTLKVIRLLAIFNLWPGDNCYMLTSQSLRFAR